jgi:hypothetical protein
LCCLYRETADLEFLAGAVDAEVGARNGMLDTATFTGAKLATSVLGIEEETRLCMFEFD